ncbi:hypothetical protein CFOL_v3_10476, partial [Cephalotus follicularis]
LREIDVYDCYKLRDLTSLIILTPNLNRLVVIDCNDIISERKLVGEFPDVLGSFNPFAKLVSLYLHNLPQLKSIYPSPLPFPRLREIDVDGFSKLRDLTCLIILASNLNQLRVSECDEMEEIIRERKYHGEFSEVLGSFNSFAKLESLELHNIPQLKSIYPGLLPFPRLREIDVYDCYKLRDLTCLIILAPNLNRLVVIDCNEMEEIIKVLGSFTPFAKLESLELHNLPQLKSIYPSPLPFPRLREIDVYDCYKLRDLTCLIILAPNLNRLVIIDCNKMEEIITKRKLVGSFNLFAKLASLYLHNLPQLKSIYQSPLPFPRLGEIDVDGCSKLRDLTCFIILATNLNRLRVSECDEMEEIISE